MKRIVFDHIVLRIVVIALSLCLGVQQSWAQKPGNIWVDHGDRFTAQDSLPLANVDSVEFQNLFMIRYQNNPESSVTSSLYTVYAPDVKYRFGEFERYLVLPSTYSNNDFYNENSKFCFQRSQESEHFIVFWEKGLIKLSSGLISLNGSSVNVNLLLRDAEKIWDKYVQELGFLEPGSSTTDKVKIEMFIVNQTEWRADGSGVEGVTYYYTGSTRKTRNTKVGVFHCNPQAASARGGHTVAHEIAHTFQYLVSADLGMSHGMNYVLGENSQGNCWWEDCANWQAYKVYPERQFSDGEYFEGYMRCHHLNILHEHARYNNCFYHDWWCQQHGANTIGRLWRESVRPEDPVQAYMRLFGYDLSSFADEMYDGFAHFASIDIDGVRSYGAAKIGSEPQALMEVPASTLQTFLDGDNEWWIVNPDMCVQNFGYNANPLKVPAAGTEIKVAFKGLSGVPGYRSVRPECAGWRYGIVAYCSNGQRHYSEVHSDSEGEVSFVVPELCKHLWFVVMGAPTTYWTHGWDENDSNDEQWPYAAKFDGTSPLGASKSYGEFPDDYARHDTTVVINASLAYNASGYTSVRVQYDMDAICQALGISTAQLKAIKRNDTVSNPGDVRFAGVNPNGYMTYNTTTSTSSETCYGHWFNAGGSVCNYDNSACIFAEMYPDNFGCNVGQYPGHLTVGKTYTIRQAIVYTHTDGKMYKAIMEVHLTVV